PVPQPLAAAPRGSSARTERPPRTLPRSVGVPPAAGSARPTGPLPHGSRAAGGGTPPHSNLVVNMSVHSAWITEEGGLPTITRRETPDHGRAGRRAIRGRAPPESAPALHLITERTFEPPRGEPDGTHDHPPQRRPSRR